jgi:glycosyltransferase involved in cell wall biosynthesis
MRILAFYPYVPWPLNRGAYHRAYHLLKGLALDHRVDLLALSENGEGLAQRAPFAEFCQRVEFVPFQHPPWEKLFPGRLLNPLPSTLAHWQVSAVGRALDPMLAAGQYDVVHILDLVLAPYFLKRRGEIPLVLDRTRVDLQYQLMEQKRQRFSIKSWLLNYENRAKLRAFEKAAARRCALQVVCGPDDAAFIRQYVSRAVPIEVIPNGVDLAYFDADASGEPRAADPTIIFCGAMDYSPNVDALRWYFAEIHDGLGREIPGLKMLIVGKDPVPEVKAFAARSGVIVTGGVPDVRPYYRRAWLQIVPLRIGGGTRLKIVESLGLCTPVVSTRIGAQGLDLEHDREILFADTAREFVRQTARALRDPGLRSRLAAHGLESVQRRLSWPKLGADLSRAYKNRFEVGHLASSRSRELACPVI